VEGQGERPLLTLGLALRSSLLEPRLRPVVFALLLAQALAAAQPRGGRAPSAHRPGSVRLPRRRLPPHGTLTGRRPRG
jgi:hypothetical protein